VAAERPVDLDVLPVHQLRLVDEPRLGGGDPVRGQCLLGHSIDATHRPREVHGGRPGGDHAPGKLFEAAAEALGIVGELLGAERHPHGRGHADRRGAANHEVGDRLDDLLGALERQIDLFARQQPLVEHDDALVGPFDGLDHCATALGLGRGITRRRVPAARGGWRPVQHSSQPAATAQRA
jgi:hypothetical protein